VNGNLPPLSGAILISNPRTDDMALALENPRLVTVNRVVRFARIKGISLEAAWAAAGFKKGSALKDRGPKKATKEFQQFIRLGEKGMAAKFRSGVWGRAGTRGGRVTKAETNEALHAYAAVTGSKVPGRSQRKKGRVSGMAPEAALRKRLTTRARAAWRQAGKKGKFGESKTMLKIRGASANQLQQMASKSGIEIVKMGEKSRQTKAKLRAHAEKLRRQGKLLEFPPSRKRKASSKPKRAATPGKVSGVTGIHFTKKGQPYMKLPDGRVRFVKKDAAQARLGYANNNPVAPTASRSPTRASWTWRPRPPLLSVARLPAPASATWRSTSPSSTSASTSSTTSA
jgi:hypothetical protein